MKRSAIYSPSKPRPATARSVAPPASPSSGAPRVDPPVARIDAPAARNGPPAAHADPSAVRADPPASPPDPQASRSAAPRAGRGGWRAAPRLRVFAWLLAAALPGVLTALWLSGRPGTATTQKDIDAAVERSLQTLTLPSQATRAYEVIRPSVVRVRGLPAQAAAGAATDDAAAAGAGPQGRGAGPQGRDAAPPREGPGARPPERAGRGKDPHRGRPSDDETVGTGVVILDTGVILTNLHVVEQAARVVVVFADGTESEASIVGMRPEHDLAVLQAKTLPDDLVAATLRSTGDLMVGDLVVAVGFPFGIGPSASSGVVSGLKREYQSAEGRRVLTNLIQFDAAANPGNSGGPLVTAEGEVVGIVTGILSPGPMRAFVGIGFAVPIENAASAVGTPPF